MILNCVHLNNAVKLYEKKIICIDYTMVHDNLSENNVKLKFAKQSYISHITKLLTLLQPNKIVPCDFENIDEKMNNNNQKFTDDVYDDHTVTTVDITSNPSSFSSVESMEDLCKLSDESFDASKFELHSILGTGSFGTVFLAEYDHTYVSTREGSVTKSVHQKYAVKSVPKHKMQDSELADLMNEKHILSSMIDPFLLRFYGSCQTNDELYFVTETVACGELFHAIYDDGGLSHADRVFYSACILLGIDYIHSKKVVFRDLKPENIMIGKNGYPKIIDFGLAKQLPYTKLSEGNIIRKYTKCYTMCGTPEYISPEMLLKKEYDYAVDLWAFGVLIYEMVFMITPFVNNADSSDFTTMFSNILQSAKQGILISKKMDKKTDGTPNSRNFVTQLLSGNEKVRLGDAASPRGLLQHPFFTPLCIENAQSNVAFSLKSAHEVDRLNEKMCTIVSGRESELYAQTYTPPSFRDVFIGRDIETRKQVKRYSGDQTRFRDFDMFLVPKDRMI